MGDDETARTDIRWLSAAGENASRPVRRSLAGQAAALRPEILAVWRKLGVVPKQTDLLHPSLNIAWGAAGQVPTVCSHTSYVITKLCRNPPESPPYKAIRGLKTFCPWPNTMSTT
jgi:hypothetical protein